MLSLRNEAQALMNHVRYAHPENGYPSDREKAAGRLHIGKTYTVTRTVVHALSTEVFLKEFPSVSFNSVLFDEVKPHVE